MTAFLNGVGFSGILGLVGCWLIVAAIIGKLVALSHVLQQEVIVQRAYQRALRAIFGAVLLAPGLHTLYQGPAAGRFVTPTQTDYLADPVSVNHTRLRLNWPGTSQAAEDRRFSRNQARLVRTSAALLQGQACRKLESFGLSAHNLRQLKYQAFHGQVYVYVGDVTSPRHGHTDIFLFSSPATAPGDGKIDDPTFQHLWSGASTLKSQQAIQNSGDSFQFFYGGAQYKLTVSQIYKVLIGNDEIVVDICAI